MITASTIRSTSTRGLGPPKNPPRMAMTSDAVETNECDTFGSRVTNQPTMPDTGRPNRKTASTNHSVRVGVPSISMVCLPVSNTMATEAAIMTANVASAGADRDHTRPPARLVSAPQAIPVPGTSFRRLPAQRTAKSPRLLTVAAFFDDKQDVRRVAQGIDIGQRVTADHHQVGELAGLRPSPGRRRPA